MSGSFAKGISRRVSQLGEWGLAQLLGVGVFSLMALRSLRAIFLPRFPWPELWRQWYAIAVQSLPIVGVTALFTGMVLALQSAVALSRFGAKPYVEVWSVSLWCASLARYSQPSWWQGASVRGSQPRSVPCV